MSTREDLWRQADLAAAAGRLDVLMNHYRPQPTTEARLAAAKAWMGRRWVLHPDNRVQRRERPYGEPR